MGCSPSKLDGLPAVALCRDRCNSLEETLRRSYALADAHSAYLLSLNTVGPSLHRFFDQAVESPPDVDSEADESPETSSPESSSPTRSASSSSDSDLPPKFDSDSEEDGNKGTDGHLFRYPNHEQFQSRNYESGINTPPPPPPSNNAWDFINFFESYEFQYNTNLKDLKDKETTRCLDEDKSTKKKEAPIRKKDEKIRTEKEKCVLKTSEKKKKKLKPEITREPKDPKTSSDFSVVTKQLQEMFRKASEAGSDVSKMFDTSRFRYHQKTSVFHGNVLFLVNVSLSQRELNPEWRSAY